MTDKYRPPIMRNNRKHYANKWEEERAQLEEKKKNAELEQKRSLENNDTNFPALGGGSASSRPSWSGKSFASLASSWKEAEDYEKETSSFEDSSHTDFILPTFKLRSNFVEEPPQELPLEKPVVKEEDEWIEVRKKQHIKKEKTLEEKYPDADGDEQDTVWNPDQPAEHETCWDERKY